MSEAFLTQVDQLIRARYTLLYVLTWEEERARNLLASIATDQRKFLLEWSITDGLRGVNDPKAAEGRLRKPLEVLNEILQRDYPAIYILKDFHEYFDVPEVARQLRDLAVALRNSHKTVVILAPEMKLPVALEKAVTLVDLPLPDYAELRDMLQSIVRRGRAERRFEVDLDDETFERLVRAAQGLTLAEAENAFARAIVRDNRLDKEDVAAVIEEKKQVIRKSGLLEYYDANECLADVGGMDLLKDWMRKRTRAFSEAARAYGLPEPKGVLLMGVQGCGKSLLARSVASLWGLPTLRMDMSRIFDSYIGSSEQNMRRALKMAEGLAPIILWADEIDKAFSGVQGSSASDAGTTARVIGTFLSWMQERSAPVFVVATANDVEGLPPELLRKGRFDETFFVDLPRGRERMEILRIHLNKARRNPDAFDVDQLAKAAHGFSGAEIEQAVIAGMYDAFFEKRDVNTEDILHNLRVAIPLSQTMRERIEALRVWAQNRARPVSSFQGPRARESRGQGAGG